MTISTHSTQIPSFLVALIFTMACFPPPSLANHIYNLDSLTSQTITPDGTTISSWEGASDDSSVGPPYVSHITTNESSFNLDLDRILPGINLNIKHIFNISIKLDLDLENIVNKQDLPPLSINRYIEYPW